MASARTRFGELLSSVPHSLSHQHDGGQAQGKGAAGGDRHRRPHMNCAGVSFSKREAADCRSGSELLFAIAQLLAAIDAHDFVHASAIFRLFLDQLLLDQRRFARRRHFTRTLGCTRVMQRQAANGRRIAFVSRPFASTIWWRVMRFASLSRPCCAISSPCVAARLSHIYAVT